MDRRERAYLTGGSGLNDRRERVGWIFWSDSVAPVGEDRRVGPIGPVGAGWLARTAGSGWQGRSNRPYKMEDIVTNKIVTKTRRRLARALLPVRFLCARLCASQIDRSQTPHVSLGISRRSPSPSPRGRTRAGHCR